MRSTSKETPEKSIIGFRASGNRWRNHWLSLTIFVAIVGLHHSANATVETGESLAFQFVTRGELPYEPIRQFTQLIQLTQREFLINSAEQQASFIAEAEQFHSKGRAAYEIEVSPLKSSLVDFSKNTWIVLTFKGPQSACGYVEVKKVTYAKGRVQMDASGVGYEPCGGQWMTYAVIQVSRPVQSLEVNWKDRVVPNPLPSLFSSNCDNSALHSQQVPLHKDETAYRLSIFGPYTPEKFQTLNDIVRKNRLKVVACDSSTSSIVVIIPGGQLSPVKSAIDSQPGVDLKKWSPSRPDRDRDPA